jgi:predicted nucleotidyltransferase
MNHKQRVEAAQQVASKLLKRYPEDIVAIGVLGSVARREDREHSDIDMQVLVRQGSRLSSHFFVLGECYFSIQVKTEEEWTAELTKPLSGLCLTAGAFSNVLVLHDPSEAFKRLRKTTDALPDDAWKAAIREGLAGIVEDLGRVRNMYSERNRDDFRLFSVLVAIGAAKVYGDLTRQILVTEKDFNTVFERREGPKSEAARRYRVAARLVEASDKETMEALEWLNSFLSEEARREDALPPTHASAKDYEPP